MICGLVVAVLLYSGNKFLVEGITRSAGKNVWGKGVAGIYHFVYSKFIFSFFPNERINQNIFKLYEIPLEEKFREQEDA